MMPFKDYINQQDNLYPLSALISGSILLFVFILAHILNYSTPEDSELLTRKVEIRELVKLKFAPKGNKSRKQSSNPLKAKQHKNEKQEFQPAKHTLVAAALMQGLNVKNLISKKNMSYNKATNHESQQKTGIATNFTDVSENFDFNEFNNEINRPSSISRGRKGGMSGGQGQSVKAGSGSSRGVISSLDGGAISGRASTRTTHRPGSGSGGPKITFPTGSGGSDASLDLHALIKWMKNHPGAIPKLVQYEMGHKRGDISSAVAFSINNRRFLLFLSCNEVELLLRICLVEDDYFTLLKDNGIREESNYLTIGDVGMNNGQIQSLISSREAPRDKAAAFYDIFWSWWQQQEK